MAGLPTAASTGRVYTEWKSSRRKGWERLQITLQLGDMGDNDSVRA